MSQCTCKCCDEPEVEAKQEEPRFQPHNIRTPGRGIHAFKGQDRTDVVKLLQKADKQEKERVHSFLSPDDPNKKARLLYEEGDVASWGMPQLHRQQPNRMPPVDFGDDEDDLDVDDDGMPVMNGEAEATFMWQKLAGITDINMDDLKRSKCVKEKVVTVLNQKYCQMRFGWSSDPDSYLEEFLLINDAKTKISVSPLVEIFQAVSKISDENDAMNTTCQVVVSKVSSLFE